MKMNLAGKPFYLRLACVLISLVIIVFVAIEGKRIVSPLVFAGLFSILLLPLAQFLEYRCGFRRNMAAVTAVAIMVLLLGGLFYFLGAEISRLAGDWPQFKQQLGAAAGDLQNWVSTKFNIDVSKQENYVHKATSKIMDSGTVVAGATLISLSSALLFISFTVVYTFFFLLYRRLIIQFLIKIFHEENSALVSDIIQEIQFITRKYITGILIEMSIVITVVCLAFSLIGIKYAILLGLITGICNLIPYIGIATAMLVSAMISFATTAATAKVIWIVAVLFGMHVIDYNILLPVIVGSKVKINAMITLLGIIVGEMIWGIAGMFLSIPIIAILKIIFDRVEALKPWGFLFGEGDKIARTALLSVKKDKPSLEETPDI